MKKKCRAVGVIVRDGKCLIFRRVKNGKEYFCLPGGSIEAGESHEEAVIRELKEELNILAEIDRFLFELENQDRMEYYYLIKNFTGDPVLSGPEKERMNEDNQYYVMWEDLKKLPRYENFYPILAKQKLSSLGEWMNP